MHIFVPKNCSTFAPQLAVKLVFLLSPGSSRPLTNQATDSGAPRLHL